MHKIDIEDINTLTQLQMATLFDQTKQNNSLHINNCFKEGALEKLATVKESLIVQKEVNETVTNCNAFKMLAADGKMRKTDIKKANEQYGNFELKSFAKSQDRFLIIDHKEVYHLGASLKDLGKKWFAFSKLEKNSIATILKEIGV